MIKHRDCCITERSPTEGLLIAAHYQYIYYHFGKDHAAKKNPMFLFNPTVHISSAFYKQFVAVLMQFVEVQQIPTFSSICETNVPSLEHISSRVNGASS